MSALALVDCLETLSPLYRHEHLTRAGCAGEADGIRAGLQPQPGRVLVAALCEGHPRYVALTAVRDDALAGRHPGSDGERLRVAAVGKVLYGERHWVFAQAQAALAAERRSDG